MSLNWIDVRDFPFDSLLLLERFQIPYLCCGIADKGFRRALGTALRGHPHVAWYLSRRCPACAAAIDQAVAAAPEAFDAAVLRECEVAVLAAVEDFVIYTRPELMDSHCDFLRGWDAERLLTLADFHGKLVLDVGAGNGRLAFAAATQAREVYAVEPVETLRAYMIERARREGVTNVRVTDGLATYLPYPDGMFDIVMSGHVVGDDYDGELAELTRVVKDGGWLIDCPGENKRRMPPNEGLRARGWEEFYYESKNGGDVYRYRLQVRK